MCPYHVALSCILNGLDDPQSLFETHLFNHICTDGVKLLLRKEKEKQRKM